MKTVKRFNSADLVIILAFITLICGFIFRKPLEQLVSEHFLETDIVYSVELYGADAAAASAGDTLYSSEGDVIGVIETIDGNGADTPFLITATTKGLRDGSGTYIGDTMFIAPGLELRMHTDDHVLMSGIVQKVETEQ